MQCIKTGCHAYLEEYNEFIYGDAFELTVSGGPGSLEQVYLFRVCERSHSPINQSMLHPRYHFRIHAVEHWFDDQRTSQDINSTLIAISVDNFGYEGKELPYELLR